MASRGGSSGSREAGSANPRAGTESSHKGSKKPLSQPKYRTLQRLLQDLEESDYAGIGAWGSFSTNPRRRVSRSFSSGQRQQQQQHEGGEQVQPSMQQGVPSANQPPVEDWRDRQDIPPEMANTQGPYEGYWGPPGMHQQAQPGGGVAEGGGSMVPFYRDELRLQVYSRGAEEELLMLEEWASRSQIISLASVARVGVMVLVGTGLAYMAVVPRHAPTQQYNYLFKLNLLLLLASLAWPMLLLGLMWRPREVNVNDLVRTCFRAFTWGYALAVGAEVGVATVVKGLALWYLEPKVVQSCPDVPLIHLPWVWRRRCARPRLTTLLLADLLVSCVLSPLLEEVAKLLVYRSCAARTRSTDPSQPNRLTSPPSVHATLVYMTGAALGLKAADNTRRILLYTKPQQPSKFFFALARGIFPVQELCGAFTALNLVRRDILGERMAWWRLLGPAVVLHSMANFRGMKPLFKWASSAPWTEMQLQSLSAPDYATAMQQIWKAVWGLVWFAVLARVLGYLLYSHYILSRQVRMRLRWFASGGMREPPAFRG